MLKLYFDVNKKIEEKKAKNLRYSQKSICNSLSHEYGLNGTTLNNRYIDAKKSSLVQWAANIMSLNQLEKFAELTKNATMPKK